MRLEEHTRFISKTQDNDQSRVLDPRSCKLKFAKMEKKP
jgi:hypothetical protein